jgi:hypothetical protein
LVHGDAGWQDCQRTAFFDSIAFDEFRKRVQRSLLAASQFAVMIGELLKYQPSKSEPPMESSYLLISQVRIHRRFFLFTVVGLIAPI